MTVLADMCEAGCSVGDGIVAIAIAAAVIAVIYITWKD